MSSNVLRVSTEDRVTTCVLSRVDAGNKLNGELLLALAGAVREAQADGSRVLVLRGDGADFSLGRQGPELAGPPTPAVLNAEFARVQAANELVEDFPGATVAVVHGRALGAGASLAGRCDLVVAARSARFAFPEVPQRIAPTVVASYFTHRLGRTALLDLLLTGREVDALEAQRLGLVSRVVDDETLDTTVAKLTAELAALDPDVVRTIKSFISTASGLDPRTAVRLGIAELVNQMVDQAGGER
ncbi:enoyl-CoA hydratase/isomerase family protein [Amycolatopsis taiwanensis]|uniref:Enoyl-CoA hydratase n=1 Tax=Amycolatopsis taiwanensis TaxID=342230 RepID=A0A9W6R771_9PSEU|nr:enoyl-CoA hydratase/isomerase family protein [Amycolatopsis taiwanensis]GLY70351.1 enoyl-CoA hydratase [Amycolatopsis taiwanensis]